MRTTKALLCAAALAVGALTSMAQVYSLNVVGYVNYTFVSGYSVIGNPLDATDNHLNAILNGPNITDNSLCLLYDPVRGDFSDTLATYTAGLGWDTNLVLNPGLAVFFFNPGNPFTNTFVGNVKQGTTSIPFITGNNAIASPVPIGGSIGTVLTGFPAQAGDLALGWDPTAPGGGDFTFIADYEGGVWTTPFNVNVGDGFFYYAGTAGGTWVRNFTVQ